MKCGSMPSLIHHADNRVQAAGAGRTKRASHCRNGWRTAILGGETPPQRPAAIVRSSAGTIRTSIK